MTDQQATHLCEFAACPDSARVDPYVVASSGTGLFTLSDGSTQLAANAWAAERKARDARRAK